MGLLWYLLTGTSGVLSVPSFTAVCQLNESRKWSLDIGLHMLTLGNKGIFNDIIIIVIAEVSWETIDMKGDDSSSAHTWHHLWVSSLFLSMRCLARLSDSMHIYLPLCFPRSGCPILMIWDHILHMFLKWSLGLPTDLWPKWSSP